MQETNSSELQTPVLVTVESGWLAGVEAAAAKLAEAQDRALRAMADLENFRKRATREKEDAIKYANERLIDSLLPVLDSFELGLASAENATDAGSISKGMKMAVDQLVSALKQHGIEPVEALGETFNPHLHEALSHQESSDHPEGVVFQQLRRGYKLNDRLLRPASVIVAKAPAGATA